LNTWQCSAEHAISIFGMTEQLLLHADGYFCMLLSTELHMQSSLS